MSKPQNDISLHVGPARGTATLERCLDDLLGESSCDYTLFVTHQARTEWTNHLDFEQESDIVVVEIQQHGAVGDVGPAPEAVDVVGTTPDLTSISLAISNVLAQWRTGTEPVRLSFCFDSLTHLLTQYPVDRVFRFSNAVRRHVLHAGGNGHFHLASGAHEQQVVETFSTLFDDVVEVSDG